MAFMVCGNMSAELKRWLSNMTVSETAMGGDMFAVQARCVSRQRLHYREKWRESQVKLASKI